MSCFRQEPSLYRSPVCLQLDRGEDLFVRSLRRWLRGGAEWERTVQEAVRLLKPAPGMVFVHALNNLATAIDSHSRRSLRLRLPGCRRVSADERMLVALIGAVQNGLDDHAGALLSYLITPAGRGPAITHAFSLAAALKKGGFAFAPPRGLRPPGAKPGLRAVA